MSLQLIQPKITNITQAAWGAVRIQLNKRDVRKRYIILLAVLLMPGMLYIVSGNIINGLAAIIIIPLFISAGLFFFYLDEARALFWKELATINGWKYTAECNPKNEKGVIFQQADKTADDGISISNCVEGSVNNTNFRIFNFVLRTRDAGRNKKTYVYTVFAFKFDGNFPHLYLNNLHNSYGIKSIGSKVPIPGQFEKEFLLSAPIKYEIEALEIFTPDVLAYLLDNCFTYDIEFVGQEMLVFIDGDINSFDDCKKRFKQVMGLSDLLEGRLNRFKFEKIGDKSYNL